MFCAAVAAVVLLVGGCSSSGKSMVAVPHVVGETKTQAAQELAAHHLVPVTKLVYGLRLNKLGTVVAQSPLSGASVVTRSKVTISVSAGPQGTNLLAPRHAGRP
jgi:beta-lactam-binding protein with PASTA domain